MRVLISGGTGFIGRSLVRSLAADGHGVEVLTRRPEGRHRPAEGVHLVGWDGRSIGDWIGALERCDAVVHLAGENIGAGRWTRRRKRRIRQSRVETGELFVNAFRRVERRPGVFLQGSAIGYYGDRGEEEVREEEGPGEVFLAAVSRDWEASSRSLEALGIRRPIARSAVVLAPEDGALAKMLLPFRLGLGGPLGDGRQWFPWIHLEDEVRALRFLLEHDEARGPFNLVAPEAVTNAEFVRTLARTLRRPAFLRVPAFALRLALGELADELLGGVRAVPARLTELGFTFEHPELGPALVDLLARD